MPEVNLQDLEQINTEDSIRRFDLNIEQVLEHWDISDAIREVIANAIDEQTLTNTKDIEIYENETDCWHIRDYGRGIKYTHLTQNENDEKLKNVNHVIGKFGVGLKDALATFDRHGINVLIKSKYGDITIEKAHKHDFEDVLTLHAIIRKSADQNQIGTEVVLKGCKKADIEKAKEYFLKFSGETNLEKTEYGEVLKKLKIARIYVHGLKVAEENNFLFSYNIISLTKPMQKALNRERINVGRTAYAERVKQILLKCKNDEVINELIKDLQKFQEGSIHDETNWNEVSVHAVRLLNSKKKAIFVTPREMFEGRAAVDRAKSDGYETIVIHETIKDKIRGHVDIDGNKIRDLKQFETQWNESFKFTFIEPEQLNVDERVTFEQTPKIVSLIGGKPGKVKEIKISETMRIDPNLHIEAEGLWEPFIGRIIIKRTKLKSLEDYSGTLLHEMAHASSGDTDVSREFEEQLTQFIGKIVNKAISGIKNN